MSYVRKLSEDLSMREKLDWQMGAFSFIILTSAFYFSCSDHVLDLLVIYCGVSGPCKPHILLRVP